MYIYKKIRLYNYYNKKIYSRNENLVIYIIDFIMKVGMQINKINLFIIHFIYSYNNQIHIRLFIQLSLHSS